MLRLEKCCLIRPDCAETCTCDHVVGVGWGRILRLGGLNFLFSHPVVLVSIYFLVGVSHEDYSQLELL